MVTKHPQGRGMLALALVTVIAVACGQLPGVNPQVATGEQGAGEAGFLSGQELDETADGGAAGDVAGGEATGTTRRGVRGTTDGVTQDFGGTTAADRTGIYEDRIVVGIHAPVTGAAPVESQAFEAGKDLYWRWLKRKGQSVFGKTVEVKFRDDTYSPSVAAQRCQEMAEREPKAFLLIGGAGTDQITACARYAASNGIPFLSAGVTEEGVASYRTFFAISATYRRQGPILAQQLVRHPDFGMKLDRISPGGIESPDGTLKIAMIRADTPNFDDSETGFREGLRQVGFNMNNFHLYKLPKEDSPTLRSAIVAAVQDMTREGIDVVYPLIAPVVVIEFVEEAEARAFVPRYVGIGITTVNQVSNVVCRSSRQSYNRASYFFPWPGWPEVMQGRFDPEYRQAVNAFEDVQAVNQDAGSGGDIVLSLWATSRVLHQMFLQAGPDMTRQSFMQTLEAGNVIRTPVYPPLRYGPSSGAHFGSNEVYRLEVECETDRAFHYRDGPVSGY